MALPRDASPGLTAFGNANGLATGGCTARCPPVTGHPAQRRQRWRRLVGVARGPSGNAMAHAAVAVTSKKASTAARAVTIRHKGEHGK
jgi:hypothetical protein